MQDISIYIHWPFCKSKCPYCDFMSIPEHDTDKYNEIEKFLLLDLKNSLRELDNPFIKTIFFGGGTPSLMSVEAIEDIINFLSKNYKISENVEISLEANPATFSISKLKEIKQAGINRLSLGIQSFLHKNLKFLGRIYDAQQALCAADMVSKIFSNFSFDFIYGYREQSLKDLEYDLDKAVSFGCPHLSFYQLTFEENTHFFDLLQNGVIKPISEIQEVETFKYINDFLGRFALSRYEISNYALPGFESRHNLAYWRYQNYLGVGPSAHSRVVLDNQKHELKKFSDIDLWKTKLSKDQSSYEERNVLTKQEQLEEIFIMGLRLSEGISLKRLKSEFPDSLLNQVFRKIYTLSNENIFEITESYVKLTENGLLKQNSIIEFLFN